MILGHLLRLGRLMQDCTLVKLIKWVHVDEAHFIYSARMEHYGLAGFRSACGRLGEFRIKFGKNIPVQALSGTQLNHIKQTKITHRLTNFLKEMK